MQEITHLIPTVNVNVNSLGHRYKYYLVLRYMYTTSHK